MPYIDPISPPSVSPLRAQKLSQSYMTLTTRAKHGRRERRGPKRRRADSAAFGVIKNEFTTTCKLILDEEGRSSSQTGQSNHVNRVRSEKWVGAEARDRIGRLPTSPRRARSPAVATVPISQITCP